MSNSDITKSEVPNPEEVLAAITSFNDPNIIVNIFKELNWSYSLEIKETLVLAKQNANLSIKFKAIKYLRELLREAAETSGYIANVSSTSPNAHGGHTTFTAKRIAGILNPVKQIESTEIKEPQNEQIEETGVESDRGCNRRQSIEPTNGESNSTGFAKSSLKREESEIGTDTREVFPAEDVGAGPTGTPCPSDTAGLGGTEPPDGGTPPERRANDRNTDNNSNGSSGKSPASGDALTENPCVKTRPPTCDRDLYPGISSAEE